jgi:hypothetical protein
MEVAWYLIGVAIRVDAELSKATIGVGSTLLGEITKAIAATFPNYHGLKLAITKYGTHTI